MLFLGIDVTSKKYDTAITSLYKEIITELFTISKNLRNLKNSAKKFFPIRSLLIMFV